MNIVLSVKRGKFRSDDPNSSVADKEFKQIRDKIKERDENRCVYCGFFSSKHHDVHHIDHDHTNNSEENLVTACSLCHMCHHISFAGLKEMGTLIHFDPSLNVTQEEVNSLARTLWFAEDSKNSEVSSQALEVYYRLFFRSSHVKKILGDANPLTLGNYLLSLSDEDYEKREKFIRESGIYLLPSKTGFSRQYAHWRKEYKGVSPAKWMSHSIQKNVEWYNIENGEAKTKKEAILAILNE